MDKRIREARDEAGMSQAELGRRAGVSSQAVSQWESGATKKLEAAHLLRAAAALKVHPDWLATGRGPKHPRDTSTAARAEPTSEPKPLRLGNRTVGYVLGQEHWDPGDTPGPSEDLVTLFSRLSANDQRVVLRVIEALLNDSPVKESREAG